MKKTIILTSLLLSIILGFGQNGEGNPKIYKDWKEKTLYVYLYPNSEMYNNSVRIVAKERWLNEKVKFITIGEDSDITKKELKTAVFLYAGGYSYSIFSRGGGKVSMYIQSNHELDWTKWYKVFKKDKEKTTNSSIEAWGFERLRNSSIERIKLTLNVLFNTLDKFKEEKYHYNSPKTDNSIHNTQENINIVKSGTLLMDEKSIPRSNGNSKLLSLEYVQQLYKGNVRIVNETELKEAIANKGKGLNYLHIGESGSFQIFSIINISKQKIIFSGKEVAKPGDSNSMKLYERMLINISKSILK